MTAHPHPAWFLDALVILLAIDIAVLVSGIVLGFWGHVRSGARLVIKRRHLWRGQP